MSQTPAPIRRLAILDDYQGVAMAMAPWETLAGVEVTVFRDTVTDQATLVQRLAPFDAILAMRERTPFPRPIEPAGAAVVDTTAARNRSIDAAACAEKGIVLAAPSFAPDDGHHLGADPEPDARPAGAAARCARAGGRPRWAGGRRHARCRRARQAGGAGGEGRAALA